MGAKSFKRHRYSLHLIVEGQIQRHAYKSNHLLKTRKINVKSSLAISSVCLIGCQTVVPSVPGFSLLCVTRNSHHDRLASQKPLDLLTNKTEKNET